VSIVLSEHLPLLSTAPNGIQKLRGLILELAVRGKLVPQDPNEESAGELVKRIVTERARLDARGACKKSKARSVSPKEQLSDLPQGWASVRLAQLGEFRGGKTPSTNRSEYWEGSIPWVSPKDMKSLVVSKTEDYVSELAISDGLAVIPASSVLIVVRSGILRRTVPVAINSVRCTVNQDLKALCLVLPDMARYVQLLIRGFERVILQTLTKVGTTVESIKFEEFSQQSFPLPPLAEQHRIIAKVDELMSLCDRLEAEQAGAQAAQAKLVGTFLGTLTLSTGATDVSAYWPRLVEHFDTLFNTESSLDALKQTVLELAVQGKLVPQDPDDEPASELLIRIAKERARLEMEGIFRKSKPTQPLGGDEPFYKIPENWSWCRLGDIVMESGAGWSPSCESRPRQNDEWGVLKVSAVSWGAFNPDENKALPSSLEPRLEHEVVPGDFLISRANTADLVARSVLVEQCPSHLMLSDKIVRLKLSTLTSARFVNLANSCDNARNYYAAVAGGTSASMKNVSREQILNLRIPLPPFAEQYRIVAKVDELMALCDRLKADLAESSNRQARLASVLIESALEAA
jgi:type I restriction enzyme S subunit